MRDLLLWIAALTIPLALFLQVGQAYDYQRRAIELRHRQRAIRELAEQNRQFEMGSAVLENPERIERLAQEELGLTEIESQRIIKVRWTRRGAP